MSNTDFALNYFFPNLKLFLFLLFIVIFFYYIVYRRYVFSIMDPLSVTLIYVASGTTIIIFLWSQNLIKNIYLYSYFSIEIAYIIGFVLFKPLKSKQIYKNSYYGFITQDNGKNIFDFESKMFFYVSSVLFLTSQSLSYKLVGIPLFLENRLLTYTTSGGVGVLARIIDVTLILSFVMLLFRSLYIKRKIGEKIFDTFLFIFIIVSSILNGSKSGILLLIFIFIMVQVYSNLLFKNNKNNKLSNKVKYMFFFAFVSVVFILMYQYKIFNELNRFFDIFIVLFLRIANSADIFVMAYPNDTLNKIVEHSNGIIAFFKDFLGLTRILDPENTPKSLGRLFTLVFDPSSIAGGANARMHVFSLYYFGYYGSILFSFILGITYSFIRNKLYKYLPKNLLGGAIYILFVMQFVSFELDPVYTMSKFSNIVLVLPFIIIIVKIIKKYKR